LLAKAINVSSPGDPTAENSEEFLELANGCLCCSIKDSGVAAIEKLMQRKGAFDHILLETTGLADPGSFVMPVVLYTSAKLKMVTKDQLHPCSGAMKNMPQV
jgi:G3E family GTPase